LMNLNLITINKEYMNNLPDDIKLKIFKMIWECGYGSIEINVGDTFGYACSDSEELSFSDWGEVALLFDRFGQDGVNAWVSLKRGCDVIPERNNLKYKDAKLFIQNKGDSL
jgi:hypothetical protein